MLMQIIATRDVVANVHGIPMFVPHLGVAIRSFGDECRNKTPTNVLGQHPEDFELVHMGEYEDTTATWNIFEKPRQIAVGANYRDN